MQLQDSQPASNTDTVGGQRSKGERRQLKEAESYSGVIACFELATLCKSPGRVTAGRFARSIKVEGQEADGGEV